MAKLASPMRTRMAWVTARVKGSRSTKVVPSPGADSIASEPPS